MIVLDTNVVSEAMKAQPTPAVRAWLDAQVAETLYLSSITLAKMLFCINNPLSAPSLIYIKSDSFPDTGGQVFLESCSSVSRNAVQVLLESVSKCYRNTQSDTNRARSGADRRLDSGRSRLDPSERKNLGSDTKPHRTTNFRSSRFTALFAETPKLTPPY